MPIYEFGCPSCGLMTTELCKVGDNGELMTCLECGHEGLLKRISCFVNPGSSKGRNGGACPTGCHGNCSGCH